MRQIHVARRLLHLTSKTKFEASKKPKCVLNPCKCLVVPCCMRDMINYSSGQCLLPDVDDDICMKLNSELLFVPTALDDDVGAASLVDDEASLGLRSALELSKFSPPGC